MCRASRSSGPRLRADQGRGAEKEASVQALKDRRILRGQNWKEQVGGGRREAVDEELPWRAEAGSQDQTVGREKAPGGGQEAAGAAEQGPGGAQPPQGVRPGRRGRRAARPSRRAGCRRAEQRRATTLTAASHTGNSQNTRTDRDTDTELCFLQTCLFH